MNLRAAIGQSFSAISKRGKWTIFLYALMLIGLSGLDVFALILLSGTISKTGISNFSATVVAGLSAIQALAFVIVIFVTKSALTTLLYYRTTKIFSNEESSIALHAYERIEALPWVLRKKLDSSDYISMIDRGPNSLVQGVVVPAANFIAESISSLAVLAVLFTLQPITALTALIFFGTVTLIQHRGLSNTIEKIAKMQNFNFLKTTNLLNEAFQLSKTMQVMPSKSIHSEISKSKSQLSSSRAQLNFLSAAPGYFMEGTLAAGILIIATVSLFTGGISSIVPAVALFAASGLRLLPSVNRLQSHVLTVRSSLPGAAEVFKVDHWESRALEESRPQVAENSTSATSKSILELCDVSFKYPGENESILNGINLSLKPNTTYAIFGPSGSGKTTLADMILGLLNPTEGYLVRDPRLVASYVPQETQLFSGDILQNVALEWGNDEIDKTKASKKLHLVGLQKLIPTVMGKANKKISNRRLSGGQKQRIGVARALYREADLIVLDEPTSSLDANSAETVLLSLSPLKENACLIIITHQADTLPKTDEVIFLVDGKISGQDRYEDLLRTNNDFRSLVFKTRGGKEFD